jgi:Tol biopolymer transport system component
MKSLQVLILLATISILASGQDKLYDFPVLKGPYLGQKPPGMVPEVFAPGIIGTGLYTRDIAISGNGSEIYFCISDAAATAIFVTKLLSNKWTEPVIAPFSGKGFLDFEPHITPDGRRFLFLSNRPPYNMEPKSGWFYQNIWMMNITDSGMSEPQLAFDSVSVKDNSYFPSVTKENMLYFSSSSVTGKSRIYKSRFENGKYGKPELVPINIPENGILFNAYISPEEDFLITCAVNIDSTNIDQDYYISFRAKEGTWSRLIKFGPEINTPGDNANSAFVSPDGRYLFFSSSRKDPSLPQIKDGTSLRDIINLKTIPGSGSSGIYWVDARIIGELRTKASQ